MICKHSVCLPWNKLICRISLKIIQFFFYGVIKFGPMPFSANIQRSLTYLYVQYSHKKTVNDYLLRELPCLVETQVPDLQHNLVWLVLLVWRCLVFSVLHLLLDLTLQLISQSLQISHHRTLWSSLITLRHSSFYFRLKIYLSSVRLQILRQTCRCQVIDCFIIRVHPTRTDLPCQW